MMVLANAWNEPPAPIPLPDALDVFLVHLQENRVPTANLETARYSDRANLAFTSMLGIGKMGQVLPEDSPEVRLLADAWPGLYKWSVFIFVTRVETLGDSDSRRRGAIDVLSVLWYTLCYRDVIRVRMVPSPRTLEIATRLWLEENDGTERGLVNIPMGTCLLQCILHEARAADLDRVVQAAGGKATEIAKLALARLQRTLREPQLIPSNVSMRIDLINALSRERDHALRNALLAANVMPAITGALVKISLALNVSPDSSFLDPMIAGLGYLRNCLESSDGFTWVAQAISAGLLSVMCNCSTRFQELAPDDFEMVEELLKILPPYLVYRSVIETVGNALAKIERGPQKQRVERSKVKELWAVFYDLAQQRIEIVKEAEAVRGKQIVCDNAKCQKMGSKEEVRRCGGCLSTHYCSKECQEVAWKEGDHKTMCKLKQRSRLEGKSASVSKRDYEFFHYLTLFDARMHLDELKSIARRKYPDIPPHKLVVAIDQSVTPATYSVKPLDTFTLPHDHAIKSMNEEARNDALIEKVQNAPESFTIVEMTIAGGPARAMVMTLATGGFWMLDMDEGRTSNAALGLARATKLGREEDFRRAMQWVFQIADSLQSSGGNRPRRRLLQ